MKIHIESSSDPSVGIFGFTAIVDVEWDLEDDEERERVRGIMADAFSEMFDGLGHSGVWFDDECSECHGRNGHHEGICMADPKNWPEEDMEVEA